MVQPAHSFEPSATEEPSSRRKCASSVKAFAARDAGVILEAIDSNLDWLQRFVTDSRNRCSDGLLSESLQVCRQLVELLGGAIGTCNEEPSEGRSPGTSVDCATLVDKTKELISCLVGPQRVSVSCWPPEDLTVQIDAASADVVLRAIAGGAAKRCRAGGGVDIFASRVGRHALIGVSVQCESTYPALDPDERAPQEAAAAALASGLLEEAFPESKILLEQGGFLDVEMVGNGGMTFYMVLPRELPELESADSGTRIAEPFFGTEVQMDSGVEVELSNDRTE